MALTTVTSLLVDPAGQPVSGVSVTARLVASASWLASATGRVVSEASTQTDNTGTWSLSLTPTGDYELADAYYELIEHVGGEPAVYAVSVPSSGPVTVRSALVNPPTSTGFTPVARLDDLSDVATSGATDGQVVTFRASDSTWIPRTPADDAVTSVAGRTGAVVLTEADVAGLAADLAAKAIPADITAAVNAHVAAADPHGDRAFATSRAVALAIVLGG